MVQARKISQLGPVLPPPARSSALSAWRPRRVSLLSVIFLTAVFFMASPFWVRGDHSTRSRCLARCAPSLEAMGEYRTPLGRWMGAAVSNPGLNNLGLSARKTPRLPLTLTSFRTVLLSHPARERISLPPGPRKANHAPTKAAGLVHVPSGAQAVQPTPETQLCPMVQGKQESQE